MTVTLDETDLRRWMRDYTGRLLAILQAYAADDVEAEDLIQEVWLRAWRGAAARPADTPLVAWLTVIALNAGRDHQRRRHRRSRLTRLWGGSIFASVQPPPSAGALHPRSRLWLAVGSLPPLQQKVLILRVLEELSTAETARIIGRAEGTVKASLARALDALREHFEAEGRSNAAER